MALDPEISLQAGQGVTPNILTSAMSDPSKLQNLLLLQGRSAAGQAYQSAIDPETGMLDQAKFAATLASQNTPGSRLVAPQMFQQSLQTAQQQQDLQEQRRKALINLTVPLLADIDSKRPDEALKAYNNTLKEGVDQGIFPAHMAAAESGNLPVTADGKGLDVDKAKMRLTEHMLNLMAPTQQQDFLYGKVVPFNVGDETQFWRLGLRGGEKMGAIPTTLTPAEKLAPPTPVGISQTPQGPVPIGVPKPVGAAALPGVGGGPSTLGTTVPGAQTAPTGTQPRISLGGSSKYPDAVAGFKAAAARGPAAAHTYWSTLNDAQKAQVRAAYPQVSAGAQSAQ